MDVLHQQELPPLGLQDDPVLRGADDIFSGDKNAFHNGSWLMADGSWVMGCGKRAVHEPLQVFVVFSFHSLLLTPYSSLQFVQSAIRLSRAWPAPTDGKAHWCSIRNPNSEFHNPQWSIPQSLHEFMLFSTSAWISRLNPFTSHSFSSTSSIISSRSCWVRFRSCQAVLLRGGTQISSPWP